jgi:hypothetical protein
VHSAYAVFDNFEDLVAAEKWRMKRNRLCRSPIGAKAVVVPNLDLLPGDEALRHPVASLIDFMMGYSIEDTVMMTGVDSSYLHAIRAAYFD